jgi:1,4-alpha-glucan branching enzyme
VLSYLRKGPAGEQLLVVLNFTPVVREGYRIGVPTPGVYRERVNSDSGYYGGSNVGNGLGLPSEPKPWMGREHSIVLTMPPLAALVLEAEATAAD